MILWEGSPHQHVRYNRASSDIFCIGLTRPHGAKVSRALAKGVRGDGGGGEVSNSVKSVFEIRSYLVDLFDYSFILVVKHILGTV